jgi:hypothetical protein
MSLSANRLLAFAALFFAASFPPAFADGDGDDKKGDCGDKQDCGDKKDCGKKEDCCQAGAAAAAGTGLLVDLGNPKCPVMGHEVDGKTWSEWNGLRIGHCCPGCIKKLAADPAAYLDKAGIEWKPTAEAVKKVNDAKGEERVKALAELKKSFKVVREEAPAPGLLVDLGNAKCAVMGEDVDGETYTEWNGLRVAFCCPGCIEAFAEDPATALEKSKIDWKPAVEAVKAADALKGEERAKALAELAKKWKVLRDAAAQAPAAK